ncbi:MAG TPA: serine protein kinase RIO [Candidatus Bathyarchaeia archaeon]|nr:serine protein kinase RIO [Candidatus Bathyarchaeia archaeon]
MPDSLDDKIKRFERDVDVLRARDKEADDFKVRSEVFDEHTLKALYRIASSGLIQALGGPISTGKEANVFHAVGPHGRELAIKIYRIKTSDFKAMHEYIVGDYRFAHVRRTKKDVVFAWTKKEFRNLTRACKARVRVPEPLTYKGNVLVMQFIGRDGVACPPLKQAVTRLENVNDVYDATVEFMIRLYKDARLVHADLSEYNILIDDTANPVFIDMGQSVPVQHPRAPEFLQRDVDNVVRFFRQAGVRTSAVTVLREITQ